MKITSKYSLKWISGGKMISKSFSRNSCRFMKILRAWNLKKMRLCSLLRSITLSKLWSQLKLLRFLEEHDPEKAWKTISKICQNQKRVSQRNISQTTFSIQMESSLSKLKNFILFYPSSFSNYWFKQDFERETFKLKSEPKAYHHSLVKDFEIDNPKS